MTHPQDPKDPSSDDPFEDDPFGEDPFADDPFGDDPFGSDPIEDDPFEDDKTVIAPLPTFAAQPETVPQPAPTPKAPPESAVLFRHGLSSLLRQAARRRAASGPIHPESVARLAKDTALLQSTPKRALLEPHLRSWYEKAALSVLEEMDKQGSVDPEDQYGASVELDKLANKGGSGLDKRDEQERAARGIGLFALLRQLERANPGRPRIGANRRLGDRIVALGQDPLMASPPGDLVRLDRAASPPMVRAQFLGLFGPFGALPLNWSEEIAQWFKQGDEAFVGFADIFVARYQELFFRAWSSAHAITQFDHPDDRFQRKLLAITGNGTPATKPDDALPQSVYAGFAGLAAGPVKSAVRLRQMLMRMLGRQARIDVEEMVPTWLTFAPDAQLRVGLQSGTLGQDAFLGTRVRTASERLRVHLAVHHLKDYFEFLPGREQHDRLRALVFWYLGHRHEVEMVLWVPRPKVSGAVLGQTTQLGWMACLAPPKAKQSDGLVQVAAFLLDRPMTQDAPDLDEAA